MRSFWFQLCLREWKRLLFDQRIIMILFGGPFFYAMIFGGVYWEGRTKHVPIVIVDQDHSRLSRDIIEALGAHENLNVVGWVNSTDEFRTLVRRDAAYACIVFPPNFERDVLAGRQPRVGVIVDANNIIITGASMIGIKAVLGTYQVGLNRQEWQTAGMAKSVASVVAMPIEPATRQLFNPTSSYSYYILMGLVCIAIQSVTRIGCGIAIEGDSEEQFRKAFPNKKIGMTGIFASKVLATAMLVLPVDFVAFSLPFILFGAPFRGSLLVLCYALPVFVLIQICAGYGYAALCRSMVVCTQLHLFMSVVVFTLSGFTWPYYVMPEWVRGIAMLTPLFHMNCLVRKLALVGAPVYLVWPHLLALAGLCVAAGAWGLWAVRREMCVHPGDGSRAVLL